MTPLLPLWANSSSPSAKLREQHDTEDSACVVFVASSRWGGPCAPDSRHTKEERSRRLALQCSPRGPGHGIAEPGGLGVRSWHLGAQSPSKTPPCRHSACEPCHAGLRN